MMDTVRDLEQNIERMEAELEDMRSKLAGETNDWPVIPEVNAIPDRAYNATETDITFGHWEHYATATDRQMPNKPWSEDKVPANWRDYPVVNVSYDDCLAYVSWLNEQSDRKFRIPTVDEVEHFSAEHQTLDEKWAVCNGSGLAPVATKEPNSFGLYDCKGNVWKWTSSPFRGS